MKFTHSMKSMHKIVIVSKPNTRVRVECAVGSAIFACDLISTSSILRNKGQIGKLASGFGDL